ncbi:DUF945 family protein [Paraglaciecola sp.]|uniref:DUF945 family protein n=1 Tax=Paraglaciecola sp. TaxID=1920173 RepID=UPI00273EC180|nr:DUF945 family protein [Paraglaciecola sp.]MDP5029306.1 YdgA family protein [Paraglaciecola sp.]
MQNFLKGAIAVAVIAGVAAAPKLIGLSVVENLNAHIAQINEIPSYQASIKEVHSTWFTTTAVIDVALSVPELDAEMQEALTFQLDFSAQHGPILMGEQIGIGREAWSISYQGDSLREKLDFAAEQALYRFNAKTSLLGATSISDRVLPFNVTIKEFQEISMRFSGYQGSGEIQGKHINYLANIEKMSIDGDGKHASIDNIQFDTSIDATLDQIFSGEVYDSIVKVSIAAMNFKDEQDATMTSNVTNTVITAESDADQANKLFHILSSYSVESYQVMGSEGQNLHLNIDMNNISTDFLKAYQNQMQEVMQNPQSDPAATQEQLLAFMDENLLDLLIASPELNIAQLSGTIDQGNFSAQLFTKLVNITALPDNMLDTAYWLSHIQASTNIELEQNIAEMVAKLVLKSQLQGNPQMAQATPEELDEIAMQQAPMILQNLAQQGLLQTTANGYKLVAELKDSQATLNGNPIPLPIP